MKHLKYPLVIVILFAGFCLWLQLHTFSNSNILWLMHVGAKMLAGGKYYQDFIEVNPPMCVYIYLPAVLLSHLLHNSYIPGIILYLFLLTIASWICCDYLLRKIFDKQSSFVLYGLEFALAFSYFILPAFNFGEREYLLVALMIPYLLMAVLRLAQQPVNTAVSLAVGIVAAIGFAQKPYFMPIWFGIEIYLLVRTKNVKFIYRPELLACISIYLLYAVSLLVFTPEYISKIIPLFSATYYMLYKAPMSTLITQPVVYFVAILVFIAVLLRRHSRYQALIDLLIIAVLGCLLVYLLQQTLWSYHILPVFMTGSLLLAVLIAEFLPVFNPLSIKSINSHFYKTLGLTISFALLITMPLVVACKSINYSLFYANLVFKQPVFKLLKSMQGSTVYLFTNDQIENFLLTDYSQTITPAHSSALWPIIAANDLAANTTDPAKIQLANKIADFIRQSEINALISAKPAAIFVQNYEYQINDHIANVWSDKLTATKHPIDTHLNFFLQDKRFAQFWQHYQYVGQMGNFSVYQLR